MAAPDPATTAMWLRGLAQDVLEHEGCDGCKSNAAQALEHLGALDEVLAALGVQDPRSAEQMAGGTDMSDAYASTLSIVWDDEGPPS